MAVFLRALRPRPRGPGRLERGRHCGVEVLRVLLASSNPVDIARNRGLRDDGEAGSLADVHARCWTVGTTFGDEDDDDEDVDVLLTK